MLKSILFFVFVLLLNPTFAHSQKLQVGDRLELAKQFNSRINYIYFCDSISDFTNNSYANNGLLSSDEFVNIGVHIILRDTSNVSERVQSIKKKYSIDVLYDEFGLYGKLFKVGKLPSVFVFDNSGTLKLFAEANEINTDIFIKNLYIAIDEIKQNIEIISDEIIGLKKINEIIVKDTTPFNNSYTVNCCKYFPVENKYIIVDNNCFLSIINQTGEIEKRILLFNGSKAGLSSYSLSAHNLFLDRIYYSPRKMNANPYLVKYTFDGDSSVIYKAPDRTKYFDPNNTFIVFNDSSFIESSKLGFINDSLFSFSVIHNNRVSFLGKPESYYYKVAFRHFSGQTLTYDKAGNYYIINNFSDTIRKYDNNCKPVDNIYCDFDSSYYRKDCKNVLNGFKETGEDEAKLRTFFENISFFVSYSLLYDEVEKNVSVLYGSTINGKIRFFLHRPEDNKSKSKRSDISIPLKMLPFKIENSILYVYDYRTKSKKIITYKITKD